MNANIMKPLFKTEPKHVSTQPNLVTVVPPVDIRETKDGYLLEAEMPGVGKDGLELTLQGHEITIVGRPNPDPAPGAPLFRERRSVEFRRAFELDPAVDTSRIVARMNQGVLHLGLPKSEQVKPRRIVVGD